MVLFMVFLVSCFLVLLLYIGGFFLSVKDFNTLKVTAFESGFKGFGKIQNSFSIHFFVMMLMFIVFDLEVVMFLGVLISDLSSFFVISLLFVFVLGGFYMEWWYGKLVWVF